jgi:hypothetical protein
VALTGPRNSLSAGGNGHDDNIFRVRLYSLTHVDAFRHLGDFEVQIELLRNPAKSIPAKIDEKSLRGYYNRVKSLTR